MYEGGYANNAGELASRDVVARAELTEVNEGRGIEDEYVHLDMRHLGEDRIMDRLENMLHLAEDFEGVGGLEEPMPVKPGQHYAMGGVEVDENGQTCIDGLYAAGETACVSMHGSNRLGGNALPELLVFGARAGHHAAGKDMKTAEIQTGYSAKSEDGDVEPPVEPGAIDSGEDAVADGGSAGSVADADAVLDDTVQRERERVEDLMESDGINHAEVRSDVQETMTDNVNVFREEAGLRDALRDIRNARERYADVSVSDPSRTYNTDLIHTIETRNVLDVAEAITPGALARREFRGAHWRAEYQERRDEEWIKHTMLTWNDGTPELYYKPVLLESEWNEYEPKERSY